MEFTNNDISGLESRIRDFINSGHLSLNTDQLESFIKFIINELGNSDGNIFKTSLNSLSSLALHDIQKFEIEFNNAIHFEQLLNKSFVLEKRRLLKDRLEMIDNKEISEIIHKAFVRIKRRELKARLIALEKIKVETGKVIPIGRIFKALSIAASVLLIFFLWQPQHSSNKRILANYSEKLDNELRSKSIDQSSTLIDEEPGTRSSKQIEFKKPIRVPSIESILPIVHIPNDSRTIIDKLKEKDYVSVNNILDGWEVNIDKNPDLLLLKSVLKIETGQVKDAIVGLENLANVDNYPHRDYVYFNLAYAYLKDGNNMKARKILKVLKYGNSKFAEQSENLLKKIRWF